MLYMLFCNLTQIEEKENLNQKLTMTIPSMMNHPRKDQDIKLGV